VGRGRDGREEVEILFDRIVKFQALAIVEIPG
jgi:hypothetical protein